MLLRFSLGKLLETSGLLAKAHCLLEVLKVNKEGIFYKIKEQWAQI